MKKQYSFKNAERGKFFQPNAEFRVPVYLDNDVQTFLTEEAVKGGLAACGNSQAGRVGQVCLPKRVEER